MKPVKRTKYLLLISLIIVSLVLFWIILNLFLPTEPSLFYGENLVVRKNYSQEELADKLWKDNLIRNKFLFTFFLKQKSITVQPGAYFIPGNTSLWKILDILSNPPSEIWVTIPEGLRKEQICSLLQKKFQWGSEEKNYFLKNSKEGYLFPETYLFDKKTSPQTAIERLNNQLQKEYNLLCGDTNQENRIIIIASLIQREAKNKQEMPVISGIIQNRLKRAMPLNIDATLQYIMGTPQNWWPKNVKKAKTIDSPFNTYKYKKLPPSPICNPGKEAIKAALNPSQTNYLYYLHDSEGHIHYAKTYQEHLQNIKKFLRN